MTSSRLAEVTGPHRRAWTAGLAAVAFSVVAVLATACGGGGSGGRLRQRGRPPRHDDNDVGHARALQRAPAPLRQLRRPCGCANPEKIGADLMKFSACMRSHGVPNFPNPLSRTTASRLQITPTVAGSPQFQKASLTCQHYAAASGPRARTSPRRNRRTT